MRKLYVLRHGNTFDKGDTVTRVGCGTDLPLSSSGLEQAERLAEVFKGTKFDAAYCSPLSRTRTTALRILETRDDYPTLEVLDFLTEIDYGPDENKPEEEVIARLGQDAIDAWDKDAIAPPGWVVDAEMIKGEWKTLIEQISNMDAGANILLVTSNGIARFLPDVVQMKPINLERKLKTGSFGFLEISDGGQAAIIEWNVRP
ncbi:MAG: histidine phosphatase family protein [Hyphomonas sp.]